MIAKLANSVVYIFFKILNIDPQIITWN